MPSPKNLCNINNFVCVCHILTLLKPAYLLSCNRDMKFVVSSWWHFAFRRKWDWLFSVKRHHIILQLLRSELFCHIKFEDCQASYYDFLLAFYPLKWNHASLAKEIFVWNIYTPLRWSVHELCMMWMKFEIFVMCDTLLYDNLHLMSKLCHHSSWRA